MLYISGLDLFVYLSLAMIIGYGIRAILIPIISEWLLKRDIQKEEDYEEEKKYLGNLELFLKEIESRLGLMYLRDGGILSENDMEILKDFTLKKTEYFPFKKVNFEWSANKKAFTIVISIDNGDYRLIAPWDIKLVEPETPIKFIPYV